MPQYTVLLLHMNGADGSTTFTDSSMYYRKTVTAYGNAQIDTAQSKFGGASGLFDGTGDYLSIPDSNDWYFGTGDFTIDSWGKFNVLPADWQVANFYTQRIDAGNEIRFGLKNDAGIYYWVLAVASGGSFIIQTSQPATVTTGVWYHVAIVRSGNNFMIFQDGVRVGSTVEDADAIPDFNSSITIGAGEGGTGQFLNGWLDEFRVSKGIARWTSNFTPPTQEYEPPFTYPETDATPLTFYGTAYQVTHRSQRKAGRKASVETELLVSTA
jgi:hypothetical protein